MGLTSDQEQARAEELIARCPEAAEFYYEHIKVLLAPLDCVEPEPCPDLLVDQTLHKLRQMAAKDRPENAPGLSPEAYQTVIPISAWRPSVQVAAVAAVVLFLISVAMPSLRLMRQKAMVGRCQSGLAGVYQGMANYVADYDAPPTVVTVAGDPWWKVGYQGRENHSNTRVVWLLAKNGYVAPVKFLCPARKKASELNLSGLNPADMNDFPSRDYIDYSFRIYYRDQAKRSCRSGKTLLMADLNPLSERFPSDYSKPFKIRLDEDVLNSNSTNHGQRGQNVLISDGSVGFRHTRLDNARDDIFTLQGMNRGTEVRGCETPSCDTDAFLAP